MRKDYERRPVDSEPNSVSPTQDGRRTRLQPGIIARVDGATLVGSSIDVAIILPAEHHAYLPSNTVVLAIPEAVQMLAAGRVNGCAPVFQELWGKDPLRAVSVTELLPAIRANIEEQYRPLWEQFVEHLPARNWYLKRESGLKAYCAHELVLVEKRLSNLEKDRLTRDEFVEFKLFYEVRTQQTIIGVDTAGPSPISDDFYCWWMDAKRRRGDVAFFTRLGKCLAEQPERRSIALLLYALLFDRMHIPMEYWATPAAAEYLTKRLGVPLTAGVPGAGQITSIMLQDWRLLALKLKAGTPRIVKSFDPRRRTIELVNHYRESWKKHRIPEEVLKGLQRSGKSTVVLPY